jgi:ATP synthase protein I
MSHQSSPPESPGSRPSGDPWQAVGYLVSGVALYGFLGWLADQWLGTSFLVAVGIVLGASLGIYLTFARFNRGTGDTGSKQEKS